MSQIEFWFIFSQLVERFLVINMTMQDQLSCASDHRSFSPYRWSRWVKQYKRLYNRTSHIWIFGNLSIRAHLAERNYFIIFMPVHLVIQDFVSGSGEPLCKNVPQIRYSQNRCISHACLFSHLYIDEDEITINIFVCQYVHSLIPIYNMIYTLTIADRKTIYIIRGEVIYDLID